MKAHAEFPMTTRDVRFTRGKDAAIYAFIMAVPKAGEVLALRSLGSASGLLDARIQQVSLLGCNSSLDWKQNGENLVITCPTSMNFAHSVVFRIR